MPKSRIQPLPASSQPPLVTSAWHSVGRALPDVLTAVCFLFAWIAPLAIDGLVRTMALVMIVEFLLIHASGFYAVFVPGRQFDQRTTITILIALTGLYLLFIVVWSLIFGQWWPLVIFGSLVVGKLLWLRELAMARRNRMVRAIVAWGASAAFYILAVILGLIVPLPDFGVTPEVLPLLEMVGEGEWMERPQTVLAAGVIYFSLLAWSKYKGLRP